MNYYLPSDPPALGFAAKMGDKLFPILDSTTTPILGVNDEAFQQRGNITLVTKNPIFSVGTGTFFRGGNHYFIVTAAHVIQEIMANNLSLSIPYGHQPYPKPFHGKILIADGIVDLALLEIPLDLMEGLVDKTFVGFPNIEFNQELGPGWFFLHGYPSSKSYPSKDWITFTNTSFTHRTGPYSGITTGFLNYDSDYHILLGFNGKTRNADDGSLAEFPASLGGISGSSIWLAFSEKHTMEEWNLNCLKVVAVETSVYSDKKVVRGTRWAGVAMILLKNYPDLQDEVVSYLPEWKDK